MLPTWRPGPRFGCRPSYGRICSPRGSHSWIPKWRQIRTPKWSKHTKIPYVAKFLPTMHCHGPSNSASNFCLISFALSALASNCLKISSTISEIFWPSSLVHRLLSMVTCREDIVTWELIYLFTESIGERTLIYMIEQRFLWCRPAGMPERHGLCARLRKINSTMPSELLLSVSLQRSGAVLFIVYACVCVCLCGCACIGFWVMFDDLRCTNGIVSQNCLKNRLL